MVQVDLLGKGGPTNIDGREVEYDVRLVNVRVVGSFIPDMTIDNGCLRMCYDKQTSQQHIQKQLGDIFRSTVLQTPRFDSSDSDVGDKHWDDNRTEYNGSFL